VSVADSARTSTAADLARQPVRRFLARVLVSDHPFPWLLPTTAMILAFGIYPLVYSIWLSLHEWNRFTRSFSFVGADQWVKALTDPRMWHALGVTTTYTVVCLAVELALGLGIALLLDRDRRGYGVLRALMTLPLVVPPAVTGLMFLLMLDGQFGVLTYYGVLLGILEPTQPLLGHTSFALVGVMLADVWQWTPFMVLIFLAGLRALPKDPFEAAAIDGANAFQIFWRLTVPMLGRVAAVAILIRAIDLFRIYDYVYVMTGGGPGTATEALSFYAGRVFTTGNFSYAATISLITLVVLIVVANLFIRLFRVRF
jgi:multiple sugar transport system permease protein